MKIRNQRNAWRKVTQTDLIPYSSTPRKENITNTADSCKAHTTINLYVYYKHLLQIKAAVSFSFSSLFGIPKQLKRQNKCYIMFTLCWRRISRPLSLSVIILPVGCGYGRQWTLRGSQKRTWVCTYIIWPSLRSTRSLAVLCVWSQGGQTDKIDHFYTFKHIFSTSPSLGPAHVQSEPSGVDSVTIVT